jgi:hypothetical protein
LKDKAFSTFLDQNPPFELRPENGISAVDVMKEPKRGFVCVAWLAQELNIRWGILLGFVGTEKVGQTAVDDPKAGVRSSEITGGDQPHNVMPPFSVVTFCVKQ